MAAARVRTNRFMLNWGWVQPAQGSFDWGPTDRFIGRLASRGIRAVPAVWGNPGLGVRRAGASPAGQRRRPCRRGGTSSRRWWRATGRAAATGRTGYRQRYGANATPLPIQSWQIWNEPNLQKYFAPELHVGPDVRPAAADLPRRDQEQGSAGPDRARRNARLRGPEGLGLPRPPLLGARDQERLRRRRPAPVRARPRPAQRQRDRCDSAR